MSSSPSARKRVLVVDDDEALVRIVSRVLHDDYDVAIARDGAEGLAAASTAPYPDLIITDVQMPKLDGFDMINKLHENKEVPRMPVIFLTTRGGAKDMISGIQAGARHYLTKPIKIDTLREKVGKALGEPKKE